MTEQNFSMYAGTNVTLMVTVVTPTGANVDIGGAKLVWYATTGPGGQVITKSTLVGSIALVNPSHGVFSITISPTDTPEPAGFGDPIVYHHECRMFLSPNEEVIMAGDMSVYPSMTAGML